MEIKMKNSHKTILTRAVSVALFGAVALSSVLYFLAPGKKSGPLNITDRTPQSSETESTSPSYIFIEEEKDATVTVEEILEQLRTTEYDSVVNVLDTSLLSDKLTSLQGAGRLSEAGYYTTVYSYVPGSYVLGKMPGLVLPLKYSLRQRTEKQLEYVQLADYTEFTAVYTDVEKDRPAIELYMGYILIDNGTTIDIYDSLGYHLMSFDDNEYVPAYARDSAGNPLFYRMETAYVKIPEDGEIIRDTDGERVRDPHEKDETVLMEGKLDREDDDTAEYAGTVTEERKVYYTLSYDGSYFVKSDYDDQTESRGLYFNYPSYYGITDSSITLSVETFDKFTQNIDGEISLKHDAEWSYLLYGNPISEDVYERAYNFSGGLGCVVTEGYYNDGGLYFINSNGNRAFNTVKKYNNENADRYVIENYMPPISQGPESIGYFYYDNGYVRARFETIDYWNYSKNNRIQVYSSEEVLLNTKGERFPIPAGYNLKGYSDGILLLERNGLYGFMDTTGDWIAQPIFSYAEAFSEGLAVLVTSDGRYGMIDTEGNIVLPFAYGHISSCSDGLIAAYTESEGWEIIRKMTV